MVTPAEGPVRDLPPLPDPALVTGDSVLAHALRRAAAAQADPAAEDAIANHDSYL